VAGLIALHVLPPCEIAVQAADPQSERVFAWRDCRQVHVVVHEAVSHQDDPVLDQRLRQAREVNEPVALLEKDLLAVVSPLGQMVHEAGNYNSR
jgi:hypothetical protein